MANSDIFACLNKCQTNYYCSYVEINSTNCNMFSENVVRNLLPSNNNKIYQRIDKVIQFDDCSNENYYISLEKLLCVPCPPQLKKKSEFPFSCFNKFLAQTNFSKAKSDCEQAGGYIPKPKSETERQLFFKLFKSINIWIDSRISQLGQEFKWNDGSKVEGFGNKEPNNNNKQSPLEENVLILSNGFFFDVPDTSLHYGVCQYD
ncbi:unnamed protein product [Brachionus calyciflorus]|uniref:C-type lectin domain-containing protein n=1 Tax=Brachionus calyciflorus TaxID=104777 RepID=A0A814I368_9BILA|nr:unnamed protein product [Brachionus calyciflorus]